MDTEITLQELYQIIGQKDVLIHKLSQKIDFLQKQLDGQDTRTEAGRSGNGKADSREVLQP